jgi:CheY-like chemotaxis protein
MPVRIDADGLILAVDGLWPMVGMTDRAVSVGSSYNSLLAKICAGKPARAAPVAEGIRAVSAGEADTFVIATNIDLRADSPYRLPSGRYVMLEVSDMGAGMDPETLTDIIMPGPNGRDLAERAVAWKPGLKVIYMSGYIDDVLINAGTRGPDVLFLRKPFQLDSLPALIREVLDTHTP